MNYTIYLADCILDFMYKRDEEIKKSSELADSVSELSITDELRTCNLDIATLLLLVIQRILKNNIEDKKLVIDQFDSDMLVFYLYNKKIEVDCSKVSEKYERYLINKNYDKKAIFREFIDDRVKSNLSDIANIDYELKDIIDCLSSSDKDNILILLITILACQSTVSHFLCSKDEKVNDVLKIELINRCYTIVFRIVYLLFDDVRNDIFCNLETEDLIKARNDYIVKDKNIDTFFDFIYCGINKDKKYNNFTRIFEMNLLDCYDTIIQSSKKIVSNKGFKPYIKEKRCYFLFALLLYKNIDVDSKILNIEVSSGNYGFYNLIYDKYINFTPIDKNPKQIYFAPKYYKDTEVIYLLSLIKSSIRDTQPLPAPENLDWQRLYNLAKSHMVVALVYSCVKVVGSCPDELLEKWQLKANLTLNKELQFDTARNEILEEFDKNGIDYLPLKGIIIKDFYPRKGMRQFSDNDILIRKKDIIAADKIMKQLSYDYIEGEELDLSKIDYRTVISYKKDGFLHFEIHNALFYKWQAYSGERGKYYKTWLNLVGYFNKVWKRAQKSNGDNRAYYLSDEDFYFYFLAHFYKHYRLAGGAGFRSFIDFYYIRKSLNLDREYLNQCLKEAGCPDLELFEKEAETITDSLFGDGQGEISSETLQYIASSGAYGNAKNAREADLKRRSKFAITFGKVFPSLTGMKLRYKVLIKAPVLLPVFYVVRVFSFAFAGKKRAKLKNAIKKFFKHK